MSVSRIYIATAADAGKRLDALLGELGLYASRSAAARAIGQGRVLVGGKLAAKKHSVVAGDAIVYELDEEPVSTALRGEPIDLDIRFEDDDLLVISKQVGLVCHPSVDHLDGTLVNALIYHCGVEHLANVQGEDDRLGIVHRLDMDTSGLMLAAKDDACGLALMEAIRDRVVDRHYLALVHGIIASDTGMIDAPIARSAKDRTRMAVRDCPSSRDAITTFKVLERFEAHSKDDGYTLIDCKLFTGRTHQIRVHMEYARHPLVGEFMYTANKPHYDGADLGCQRQFLHSFKLRFEHPMTGEELFFADNLPGDLRRVLAQLTSRSMGKTAAGEEIAALLEKAPFPSVEGVPFAATL